MTADPFTWTGTRQFVLRALVNSDEPLWPLALAHAASAPYGTVYAAFRELYDLGWAVGITGEDHPGRPARVHYRLTELGREKTKGLR